MKQWKKMLSLFLAVIMAFSVLTVGVSAQKADLTKVGTRTLHGKPALTSTQRATLVLDYLDNMLAEKDMTIKYEVLGVGINLDFRSIDRAFDSLYDTINSTEFKVVKGAVGDIADVKDNHLKGVRRTTPGLDEIAVIYNVLLVAQDNASLVRKFIAGKLDLGVLNSFVGDKLDFDIAGKVKDKVAGMILDENLVSWPAGVSLDSSVQTLVDAILVGGATNNGKLYNSLVKNINKFNESYWSKYVTFDLSKGLLPSMKGKTNISSVSLYSIIENAVNAAINDYGVGIINNGLKRKLKEFAGYEFKDENDMIGDDSNVSEVYKQYINFDYNFTGYQFSTTSSEGIFGELNNLVDYVLGLIWKGPDFWQGGSNKMIIENLRNAAVIVYDNLGDEILPASADKKTPEEIHAMSAEELICYVASSFLESKVDYMQITTCSTLEELACYIAIEAAADIIPDQNYKGLIANGRVEIGEDLFLRIMTDIGVYYLKGYTEISGLQYGVGLEKTLKKIIDWALQVENFGGIFSSCDTTSSDPWVILDNTVFKLIPLSYFGGNLQGSKDLVMNHLIGAALDLDLDAILSLLYKNPNSVMNKPLIPAVITVVNNILSVIAGGVEVIPSSYTSLDLILNNSNLGNIVVNLINGLIAQGSDILRSALQFVTGPMHLEDNIAWLESGAAPADYPNKTIDQLTEFATRCDESLGKADDPFSENVDEWNYKTDFDLYYYRQYEDAVDDAMNIIEDLAAFVLLGGTEQEFLAQEGMQQKVNDRYYALETSFANLQQREPCTTQLDYVLEKVNEAGYKKSNYPAEVWDYFSKVLKHAKNVSEIPTWADEDEEVPYGKQSMINEARRMLVSAVKLLENPTADYTALDKLIKEVQAMDLTKYTEESVEALRKVLADAIDLSRLLGIDDQDEVDKLVTKLTTAINNLVEAVVDTFLEAIEEGVKLDKDLFQLSGLEAMLSVSEVLEFIGPSNGGEVVVETADGSDNVGTGTKVSLYNGGELIESYDIVIYGDVSGDGIIDEADTIVVDNYMNWIDEETIQDGNCFFTACELSGDGIIDETDTVVIDNVINWFIELDQKDPFNPVIY